jgi:hypothetical protein
MLRIHIENPILNRRAAVHNAIRKHLHDMNPCLFDSLPRTAGTILHPQRRIVEHRLQLETMDMRDWLDQLMLRDGLERTGKRTHVRNLSGMMGGTPFAAALSTSSITCWNGTHGKLAQRSHTKSSHFWQ